MPPKILVFAGSARSDSLNKKLARVAAAAASAAGADAMFIDLDDYPLPVYHGDLEARAGLPENARRMPSRQTAASSIPSSIVPSSGSATA